MVAVDRFLFLFRFLVFSAAAPCFFRFGEPLPCLCFPPLFPLPSAAPTPNVASNASPAAPAAPSMSRRSPVLARAFSDCSMRRSPALRLIEIPRLGRESAGVLIIEGLMPRARNFIQNFPLHNYVGSWKLSNIHNIVQLFWARDIASLMPLVKGPWLRRAEGRACSWDIDHASGVVALHGPEAPIS